MSAVPLVLDPELRDGGAVAVRPRVQSRPGAGTKARSRSRVSSRSIGRWLVQTVVLYSAATGGAFLASQMAGSVLVEKARREGIRATERAREAKRTEVVLRNRVQELNSLAAIETWASVHGFRAPYQIVQPSEDTDSAAYVATRNP